MNPYAATLVNGYTLIIMSLWGYLSAVNGSMTALIPMAFGVVLLLLSNGVRKGNKTISYLVVLVTLVIIFSLYMPFQGALERGNNTALFRVLLMVATGVIAVMAFVKAFVRARKGK
nr:hypothetical protein [Saprospiraceae bacterium]